MPLTPFPRPRTERELSALGTPFILVSPGFGVCNLLCKGELTGYFVYVPLIFICHITDCTMLCDDLIQHCATIAFAILLCPRGGLRTAMRSFQHLLSSTNIHPVSESHPALMRFFICYRLRCLCDLKSSPFKSLG